MKSKKRKVKNKYDASHEAWSHWSKEGRWIFNTVLSEGWWINPKHRWNAAFMLACEYSKLNIEYEPRGGWDV